MKKRQGQKPAPVEIPIDGNLDLHTFLPAEVKSLVPEYLRECRDRGIFLVRIIHGKGSGAARETVHALLRTVEYVASFQLSPDGNWGVTIVELQNPTTQTNPKR